MFGQKALNYIFNGIVALALSILIWRLTHNFVGWLVLALPGGALILYGWYLILKEDGWF
jgi:hypothetical protein